jgi:hypothetical protein
VTLRIISWLWHQPGGRTAYTAGHANIWAAQVRRHLTIPHTIALVTDMPEGLDPSIEVIAPPNDFVGIETPTWNGHLPNCFRRLALFRRDAAEVFGGERIVSMDLDCVIADSLDPLFDRSEDLVLYAGTNFSRPYNGSMAMLTAGCRPQVYERFNAAEAAEAGARFLGSDQSWISHVLGWGEATWTAKDGVAWWGSQYNEDLRLMFFPGNPKPWNLVGASGWVTEHYRGAEGGRCIVLSVGPSLWADVAAAGPYDAVIALPEAAEHWPGPVREVVADEREAAIAVRMHGFDEAVWCGRETVCAFSA